MRHRPAPVSRRALLAGAAALSLLPAAARAAAPGLVTRPVPKTGERIPALGMGTWITFNVGRSAALRRDRMRVLETFFDLGGRMVDSSPMYGSAEAVLGWCLERLDNDRELLSATKIWTPAGGSGAEQLAASRRLWGLPRIDVMQVHNLVDWEAHLPMLLEAKQAGAVRHVGVTTSHGARHGALERIMRGQPIDFVQFTYNIRDRAAEKTLLPLAAERGIAVIVNRPFRRAALFDEVDGRPLPGWAREIGCESWAQAFLKFILGHPAVTCAIPATSRVAHMKENMAVLRGPLPDAALRRRMAADFDAL